tara:strand:+ start:265 stop:390 length:126 start_codon:yes stop_codon:yes gene_type:complete
MFDSALIYVEFARLHFFVFLAKKKRNPKGCASEIIMIRELC